MMKYLVGLLLIASTLQASADSSSLFLSPQIPNTGFEGQYYEVRFRVRGLDYPTFTFSNLPSFLNGTTDGILSGTPDKAGSYKISVAYASGNVSGSTDVVVRITQSAYTAKSQAQSERVVLEIFSTLSNGGFVFTVNSVVNIQLSTSNAKAPVTWDYQNLPSGLSGDASGKISGKVGVAGYYTLSCSASDNQGNSAQSYYTLNVQPSILASSSQIVDVPNKNDQPLVYNASQVANQQLAADNSVFQALKVVNAKKAIVVLKQQDFAQAQFGFNFATTQAQKAEVNVQAASQNRDNAQIALNAAAAVLDTATHNLELANQALKDADANVATAQKNLNDAQTAFNSAKKALDAANAAFLTANDAYQKAVAALNQAIAARTAAQNDYNNAFNNLQDAKKNLDNANNVLLAANAKVANAQNAVDIANQDNENAQANLNAADAALTASENDLIKANAAVSVLRAKTNDAKSNLGQSNFNLQQALNQLFVAQAAKEAADKATSVAAAQGNAAADILKGNSTQVFSGCYNLVYPSVTGSSQVVYITAIGAKLASGQILTWGSCTDKGLFQVGDYVTFSGSLVNGAVNCNVVTKN